jgi:hypothetical protein
MTFVTKKLVYVANPNTGRLETSYYPKDKRQNGHDVLCFDVDPKGGTMSGMPTDAKALIGMPISGLGIPGGTTKIMNARYDRSNYNRMRNCVFITLTDNIPKIGGLRDNAYKFGVPLMKKVATTTRAATTTKVSNTTKAAIPTKAATPTKAAIPTKAATPTKAVITTRRGGGAKTRHSKKIRK